VPNDWLGASHWAGLLATIRASWAHEIGWRHVRATVGFGRRGGERGTTQRQGGISRAREAERRRRQIAGGMLKVTKREG
jgi:hypothetical protein